MKLSVQGVRGMPDILSEESRRWRLLEAEVRAAMDSFGYQEIRTPLLEHEELFVESVGEDTDIVAKELYRCSAGPGDKRQGLCLRPEGTAATVRALAQAGLLRSGRPRVWYMGPMFRHERQQAGRQRQFHQFGCEFLNNPSPAADCEVIALCADILSRLGLKDVELRLNNLGRPDERQAYQAALQDYLRGKSSQLSAIDQERLERNPLRVLDSKEEGIEDIIAAAPQLRDFLAPEAQQYFEQVLESLDALKIKWQLDPLLVRGLDYYNLTVFEWIDPAASGRQNSLIGGGRYDGLLARISDTDCPGTGMAAGMERILRHARLRDEGQAVDVYLGLLGDEYSEARLLELAAAWRAAGLSVQAHLHKDKIGAFLKAANSSDARLAAFVGAKERAAGSIAIKPLRDGGEQFSMPAGAGAAELKQRLGCET